MTTPLELEPGAGADIAAAMDRHPFFSRLAATEHDDQPRTANAGADKLAGDDDDAGAGLVAAVGAALTGEPPATDGPPPTAGDDTLDDEPGDEQPPAPVTEPVAPSTFTVRDGDEDITLTAEQMQAMLAINKWASNVQPEVARQFAAVEQGVAVAVPTDEYAAYQVWLQTQRQQTQNQQPAYQPMPSFQSGQVAGAVPEWVQDLDPEAQQFLAQLQASNAQMQQHLAALEQQNILAQQPQISAQQQQVTQQFDTAVSTYAQANGLTNDQAGELLDIAVRAGIIPTLAEQQRVYSPSGALVRDADYALIARQALDFGRLQRPDLAFPGQAPASATGAGGAGAAPVAPTTSTPPAPHVDPVAFKKARSASLAAAPSAATVPPGYDPATASPQQQREAMAKYLRDQGIAS